LLKYLIRLRLVPTAEMLNMMIKWCFVLTASMFLFTLNVPFRLEESTQDRTNITNGLAKPARITGESIHDYCKTALGSELIPLLLYSNLFTFLSFNY
jgi:hypothetical protein